MSLRLRRATAIAFFLVSRVCAHAADADRYRVDWNRLAPEILQRFSALVRIDTSNPPGNETKAATAIQEMLRREDIPSQLFALDPARANLVARLRGHGGRRPLLLMAHTDVAGAGALPGPSRWSVDPFGATRKDGFIYGRGTLDDKAHAAAFLTVLTMRPQGKAAILAGRLRMAKIPA